MNTGASTTCQPGVGAKNSDYVLAGGTGDQTPYPFDVISPVFAPPDGIQSGFNGDYSGITINAGDRGASDLVGHAQRQPVPGQRRDPRRGHLHRQRQPAERQGQAGSGTDRQVVIASRGTAMRRGPPMPPCRPRQGLTPTTHGTTLQKSECADARGRLPFDDVSSDLTRSSALTPSTTPTGERHVPRGVAPLIHQGGRMSFTTRSRSPG